MRIPRGLLPIICALLFQAWPGLIAAAEDSPPPQTYRFINEEILHFGMPVDEAVEVISDAENWLIGAEVATASTNELYVSHNGYIMYVLRFFHGNCWYIEKRAVMSAARAAETLAYFSESLGPAPENAKSRAGDHMYAVWLLEDRQIELTTMIHDEDTYRMFYEEYDPLVEGEYWRTLEREISSQEVETDPVTGRPRVKRD